MLLGGRLERLERLALLGAELVRHLEQQAITRVPGPALAQARHALAPKANHLLRLTAGGGLQLLGAVQHGDLDLRSRLPPRSAHRTVDEQIRAVELADGGGGAGARE